MADKKAESEAAPQGAGGGAAQGEKLTKKEAVQRALAAMGRDAKPTAMKAWIKDNLGVEMSADHVSTTKGEILRNRSRKKSAAKPGQARAAAAAAPAPAAAPEPGPVKAAPAANGTGIQLEDILTVKALVGRVGPDQLRTLIDVLSR